MTVQVTSTLFFPFSFMFESLSWNLENNWVSASKVWGDYWSPEHSPLFKLLKRAEIDCNYSTEPTALNKHLCSIISTKFQLEIPHLYHMELLVFSKTKILKSWFHIVVHKGRSQIILVFIYIVLFSENPSTCMIENSNRNKHANLCSPTQTHHLQWYATLLKMLVKRTEFLFWIS